MQTTINTISATNVFSASASVETDIPRSGFIPDIGMVLEARYDNSGAPTFYSDVFDRIITALVLEGDGRQFVNISDMRLLAYLNILDYGLGYKRSDPVVTTTSDLQNRIPYKLHFGNNPYDMFDPLASDPSSPIVGIPASSMNTLRLRATWGATTAMAASVGVVDTATALRIAPHVITPGYGEGHERFYPKISSTSETFTATWTNFGKTFNVPVGGIVRRAILMAVDGSSPSIRTNIRPTRVGLISPKDGNAHRIELAWDEFQQMSGDQYPHAVNTDYSTVSINQLTGLQGTASATVFPTSQPVGLGVFDFRKIAMRRDGMGINPLGADMRGLSEGDLKIGIDWDTATGQLFILWDALEPFVA